jgi:hypothetical protein
MRFLAWFARHPRLRKGVVLVVVAVVLYGGARLWTSGPDSVHITVTAVDATHFPHLIRTITFDRTIDNSTIAQRLQRELAAMPVQTDPFAAYSCPVGAWPTYDSYTLTWFRLGLPVEQASADDTGCAFWHHDIVFWHVPAGRQVLYADIAAVVTASG